MITFVRDIFLPKNLALAFLVLQNTFLVVFMHYSRTVPKGQDGGTKLYASSTAVATMEVVKMFSCCIMITYDEGGIVGLLRSLYVEIAQRPSELLVTAIPSVLYSIQNNLLYYALSHLDASTFQVGYQLKLLTTAIFSIIMMNKQYTSWQWFSLVILTGGVAITQLSAHQSSVNAHNTLSGFIAVLLAACTSGFAGVYTEKLMKSSKTTVWMRNVQIGISSLISALLGIYLSGDLPDVLALGFFHGYNNMVIYVILLQAVGGLIVGVVVKLADNILKGYATSFSILTSCLLEYIYFDFTPTWLFSGGAGLVIYAMYLYATPVAKPIAAQDFDSRGLPQQYFNDRV